MSGAAKGHVNPMVGVAQELVSRGHDVTWLCFPQVSDQFARAGVKAVSILENVPPMDFPVSGEPLVQTFGDSKRLNKWLRTLLLDVVEPSLESARRVLRAANPDVVAFDPMLFVAALASSLENRIHVGLSSGLNPVTPEGFEAGINAHVQDLSDDRAKLFAKYSVPARFQNWEYLSPYGTLVFSTPEYVSQEKPEGVYLVGPSRARSLRGDEADFDWRLLPSDHRPLLYVSFGSQIYWQPALFEKIIRVAAKLPVFTILSCGELADRYQNIENVLAVRYAPQREILERASAFISHGGANSVMEALDAGVPLLLNPLSSDQPLQAQFLVEAEAGARIDLASMTDDELRLQIEKALKRESCARLSDVQDSYRKRDGAKEAADFLEQAALK